MRFLLFMLSIFLFMGCVNLPTKKTQVTKKAEVNSLGCKFSKMYRARDGLSKKSELPPSDVFIKYLNANGKSETVYEVQYIKSGKCKKLLQKESTITPLLCKDNWILHPIRNWIEIAGTGHEYRCL